MPRINKLLLIALILSTLFIPTNVLAIVAPNAANSATGALKEIKDEKKNLLLERQNQLQQLNQDKKASVSALRNNIKENIDAKRAEFQKKLQAILDEKKKALISKINEKLNEINKRRTGHFLKVLERLGKILNKIESRATELSAAGVNITPVTTAVASAKTSIAAAKTEVDSQSEKTYTADFSSVATLRADIGKVISGLEADLRVVNDLVNAAKQSVVAALKALRDVKVTVSITPVPTVTVPLITAPMPKL